MWAQEQIFVSVNIFRLWSKYILYYFKNPDKLPDHSYTHKTSLHPFWHHFIEPFDHHNYFKFLSREDVCEASAILVSPFGMSFLHHLHMTKWLSLDQFELKWTLHMSASCWSSFLDQVCSCEATAVNLDPFTLPTSRVNILRYLNLPDKLVTYLPSWFNNRKLQTASYWFTFGAKRKSILCPWTYLFL